MVANKKRLYIALYPCGVVNNEERRWLNPSACLYPPLMASYRYHWGFLIGPKVEEKQQAPGMRYHVKNHPISG
jgi:hypothetical protein